MQAQHDGTAPGCGKMLEELVADMALLNIKAHNLHWNVVGDMFFEAHAQLQDIYEWAQGTMDEIAELLRMLEHVTETDFNTLMLSSGIKPAPMGEILTHESFSIMVTDLLYIRTEVQAIYDRATEMSMIGPKEVAEDMAEYIDKKVWFLKSVLKGGV